MNPIIFYRPSLMEDAELAVASKYFEVTKSRVLIGPDRFVIGRFSMLPEYEEVARDVRLMKSTLINSERSHMYVADLGAYAPDLGDLTFQTWDDLSVVPKSEAPFVLKGATTSMKHLWPTHMFAKTWEDAVQVRIRLNQDLLVSTQQIYVRKYVELDTLWTALGGMRITREHRIFVYRGEILSRGFYWQPFVEDLKEEGIAVPDPHEVPADWLAAAIGCVRHKIPFFAMDVARDVAGQWWVVEINDGQQSGLGGNSADLLYGALRERLA